MNRLETLAQTPNAAMVAAIVVASAASVFALIWLFRRHRSAPRQIHRLIRSISLEALIDVVIPDGMSGEIHIDHLLLTPRGLLLLEFKDLHGAVFAGDKLDLWSAGTPGSRFTFENPLPHMQERAAAVACLAPGIPIEFRVVFTGAATFPKGHPDTVTTLDALLSEYQPVRANRDRAQLGEIASQWERVKAAAADAKSVFPQGTS